MAQTAAERFQEMVGKSPEEAKFYWSGGPVELAERTWFQSMFSGCVAFETDEGLVLVDSGLNALSPALAGLVRSQTKAPVHTAIFTQGHLDHAFGLKAFLAEGQQAPRIIAHSNMPARFARYQLTAAHNQALNARQFGGTVQAAATGDYDDFGPPELPPNMLYDDRIDITVGGVRFEIHHCQGETDDHTWVYCPDRGVLCPGDLFTWAVPNAGNPQKVQRYVAEWAAGLREMAAKEPDSMGPGHGGPVVRDRAKLQRMLLETADYLEAIHERTVAALNNGSPPHVDIVEEVPLPDSNSPWLQPVYDEGEFIIRNIIRHYGGWWNGRPSDLKPAGRQSFARELASLAGGVGRLTKRLEELDSAGDTRLAGHFADLALEAAPEDPEVQAAVAAYYDKRADAESSLMASNLFSSAAAYAREGRPFR